MDLYELAKIAVQGLSLAAAEKKIQIILSYIGVVLILALMFWVIGVNIWQYCFN